MIIYMFAGGDCEAPMGGQPFSSLKKLVEYAKEYFFIEGKEAPKSFNIDNIAKKLSKRESYEETITVKYDNWEVEYEVVVWETKLDDE